MKITNRERFLARAFIRNSYELDEAEIDQTIEDVLEGIDVTAAHREQLAREREREKEKEGFA